MTQEDAGAGYGAEREPEPQRPAAQDTHARGRHDGITKLTGSVSFSTTGASMDMAITGGSALGTSLFEATGARGNAIGPNPPESSATLTARNESGKTVYHVTATGLPSAKASEHYTVRVSYSLTRRTGPEVLHLEGNVAPPIAIPGTAQNVSMTPVTT